MDFSEIVFPDHAGLQLARPNSLGSGAFGITWLVRAPLPGFVDSPQVFVLKVLKTGIVPKPGSNPRSDFVEESDMLQRLRHQGVPRVVGRGLCRVRGEETPYYLTEYEDAIDLERLLKDPENAEVDADFAIRFLTSVLEVLEYCHRHQVLHLDIKPDNILVGSREKPATLDADSFDHAVLIDFGKAKAIDDLASGKYTTAGGGSFHYVHPALHSYLRPNKVPTDLFRESGPGFDLFSLSAVLTRDLIPKVSASGDAPHYVDLLRLLAEKLENPDCTKPGYSIFSAQDALACLRRFPRDHQLSRRPIRLSAQVSVATSSRVRTIIDTPEFQRLRRVAQLGLTHLVYPSATHTRFSHSLGAYEMAGRYAAALSREPLFSVEFSPEDIERLRIRALLHDIGHYPFAHYFEEFGGALPGLRFSHTLFGEHILRGALACQERAGGHTPLRSVIDPDEFLAPPGGKSGRSLLDAIVDGPVDCDKLDYLIRDGVSCGVPYAASIDVDRFLASLTWVTQADQYQLAVTPKGISAAETILIARYQLFAEVYWHKTCRALVAMFKEAVRLIDAGAKFTQAEFDEVAISGGDNVMLAWLHDRLSTIDNEAATDLIGALIPGSTRLPYKRIATYSFTWARGNTQLMYHEIGHANLTRLIEFRNYVLQNLNDEGQKMSPATWSKLKPHHLLIDIPPQHKAQLGEPSVRYPDRVPGSERVKISEVSHLLHSLDDAVRLKVHRIRIFVHPSMRDQVTQVVGADARGFFDTVIPRFFSR